MQKIKTLCIKISIHFVIWLTVLVLADFCAFVCCISLFQPDIQKKKYIQIYTGQYREIFNINIEWLKQLYVYNNEKYWWQQYREPENIFSPRGALLLLGCSYAYGQGIKYNETFSHQLASLTNRPVYNRALMGRGIQYALYQLQSEAFYDIIPKPEYVFYLFINDHMNRFDQFCIPNCFLDLFYEYKNGCLIFSKQNILKQTFLYRIIKYYFKQHDYDAYTKYNVMKYGNLLLLYFSAMRDEIQTHWGDDTKFIILTYEPLHFGLAEIFEDLEQTGFAVIRLNELLDSENPYKIYQIEYRFSENDNHPTAKLWRELTPKLVDYLDLNSY